MTDSDALAALADIELPGPPDWRPLIALAAAILLLTVAVVVLYIRQQKRQKASSSKPLTSALSTVAGEREKTSREALARLARLQQDWTSGAIDARAAAYRLGTLLRLGLALPQLHPAAPPSGLDARAWHETLTLLQGLRYAPAPTQALTRETFERARHWLSRDEHCDVPHHV